MELGFWGYEAEPMSATHLVKLGDLIEVQHGYAFESVGFQESGEFALLTPGNFHEEGGFRRQGTQQKRYAGVVDPKWILKPGAILVAMTEQAAGLLGAAIRIPEDDQWLHNQRMGLVEIKCPDRLCAGYLYHWFNSASARKLISVAASGTKVRDSSPSQIYSLHLSLPDRRTQLRAAETLDEWYAAIEKTSSLLLVLERRKQGLMQQLLTGGRRLKGFKGKWKLLRADKLFTEISVRNQTAKDPLLSVTQDRGVIPRDMLVGRVTMPAGTVDAFKLVERDNFVISLRSFQGGLEHSAYRGLVSPAYTVLQASEEIHPAFFRHYFKSTDFVKRLSVAVVGIRDGKQISYTDFRSIKLPLPPMAEQQALTELLDLADQDIALCRERLDGLQCQKRALMQKLLSGEWRFPESPVQSEPLSKKGLQPPNNVRKKLSKR